MSHCVENMFSVREKPWHYEETKDRVKILSEAPTSEEAIKLAGLDWQVVARPIYDRAFEEIKGFKANTRVSDNSILGIVTDRYKIVQNSEAFAFTDSLIENHEMVYETAGSLKDGKTIWLLGKLPNTTILGDEIEPYICFTNSHDGTGAIKVCLSPIRVVCNNTLNIALNGAKRCWSTKHMGDLASKLEEARETLGFANHYMETLGERAEQLADKKIMDADIEHILNEMFPVKEDDTDSKKEHAKIAKDSFYLCYAMPDIAQFKGTVWGAINAMADFVDHSAPLRNTTSYRENNWGRIMNGHPILDTFVSAVSK